MKPEYLADAAVDAALDEQIRTLLTTCFTGPQDVVFKTRRYFHDPYPHRWVIKNEQGELVAHVGVHERCVTSEGITSRIIGMAEVCVRPDYRGRGFIGMTFRCIHAWAIQQGFDFSVLFGDPKIYGSSGYTNVTNLFYDSQESDGRMVRKQALAMVKTLTTRPWPTGQVSLQGLPF
jgi:predicted N-acetyltransferase YhbS